MKIVLSLPPLLNRLYRISGGRFYKNQEAIRYKNECAYTIRKILKQPTDDLLELNIKWYRKALRGDIDAILKCFLDALEGILWENDSQIMKITIEKLHDKNNPRIELECIKFKKLDADE